MDDNKRRNFSEEEDILVNAPEEENGEEEQFAFGRRPLQYSRTYKRFFEDWEEHEVMVGPGKFRTERIYKGDYYLFRGGRARKRGMAACYIVLLAGILALFFQASTKDISFNYAWYAAILQTLILLSWLWMGVAVLSWLLGGLRMTIGELRSGPKAILRATKAGGLTGFLAAGACLLQMMVGGDAGQLLYCAVLYAGCAALAILLGCLERSNDYTPEE